MLNLSSARVPQGLIAILLFFTSFVVFAANPCIDINTAPQEELEKIKHIGESRAKQIIALRGERLFSSVDELDRVIGIGPARVSDIKQEGLACVEVKLQQTSQPATTTLLSEIEPQKATETGLAAANDPIITEQSNSYPLGAALALAILSGFVILLLKHVRT